MPDHVLVIKVGGLDHIISDHSLQIRGVGEVNLPSCTHCNGYQYNVRKRWGEYNYQNVNHAPVHVLIYRSLNRTRKGYMFAFEFAE